MTDQEIDLPMLPEQHFTAAGRRRVHEQLRAAPTRRWRTRRAFVGVAVAGLVVTGGGVATAVVVLGSAPVTDHSSARCYSKISTEFGDNFPGTTVGSAIASDGSGGQVVAPISACAAVWEQTGLLRGIAPQDAKPPYPVPHLIGCVLPDGRAAVFPGPDDTCGQLGLQTALSDTTSTSTNPSPHQS